MSVESCSNESNIEFTWEEECEFDSIWQGRVVSKHTTGLKDSQDRIEDALQDAKPHIAAASKHADYFEKQFFNFSCFIEGDSKDSTTFTLPSETQPNFYSSQTPQDLFRTSSIFSQNITQSSTPDPLHNSEKNVSERLPTLGTPDKHMMLLAINGMNTTKEEALDHQRYLKTLMQGDCPVDFIYNRSHNLGVDLLEIISCNFLGFSPNTAHLLKETWQDFHEQNKDYPNKKILQICHSQATIHVYNALISLPKEITDRVLVVTIAPAKVVPKNLCFDSFNYASNNVLIHYGELMHAGFFDTSETGNSFYTQFTLENREELILLDAHQDAKGIDHSFQSPTFRKVIEDHLNTHIQQNGEYPKKS